jgi:hypothetical protein
MKSTGPKFTTAEQLQINRARAYNQNRSLHTWEVRRTCTLCNEVYVTDVHCYGRVCDDCEEVAPDLNTDESRAANKRIAEQQEKFRLARLARRSA